VQEVIEAPTSFMWLELTGQCQLECAHCYAESGPKGRHSTLSDEQWIQVIEDAATAGVTFMQFIGGEPTRHPALNRLIVAARDAGLGVEVFSNLVHVRPDLWDTFVSAGVRLATSYYAADDSVHDAITRRVGSHQRTRRSIERAIAEGIEIRVGIIQVDEKQSSDAARLDLLSLGVQADHIGFDSLREVGRGATASADDPLTQFCGKCASGVLAVLPDGSVQPCVFARQPRFTVGNLFEGSLLKILAGDRLRAMRSTLSGHFDERVNDQCPPHGPSCPPNCLPECWPGCEPNCAPRCSPTCGPTINYPR
jgi:radical SAM protein with 4Fe4S-binding SPASM domain